MRCGCSTANSNARSPSSTRSRRARRDEQRATPQMAAMCEKIKGEREPSMRFFQSCGMLLVAAIAAGAAGAQEGTAVKELIPTGKLRVGVVFAPAASAFFVVKDANGEPHGVTVDLARELAKQLGVPLEF